MKINCLRSRKRGILESNFFVIFKSAFILFALMAVNVPECQASNGYIKELQVEDDGFRWYKMKTKKEYYRSIDDWTTDAPYGAMDTYGNIIVPRRFDRVWYYDDKEHFCVELNGKPGIYSTTGDCIIPTSRGYTNVYQRIDEEDNYVYYRVEKNGYEGICDTSGKEIIPPSRGYTNVYRWYDKEDKYAYYRVKKDGYVGICDTSGKEIIPLSRGYTEAYKWLDMVDDNYVYFHVEKNSYGGICATDGTELIAPNKWESVIFDRIPCGDFYHVKNNGIWGIMKLDGTFVISPDKYEVTSVRENNGTYWIHIVKDGKCGVADIKGNVIIAPKYEYKGSSDGGWYITFNETKNRFVYRQESLDKETTLNYSLKLFKNKDPQFGHEARITTQDKVNLLAKSSTPNYSSSSVSSPSSTSDDGAICHGTYVQSDRGFCLETQQYTPSSGSQWTHEVVFYDDHITVGGAYCSYIKTFNNGTKLYDGGGLGNYEVTPSYGMRLKNSGFGMTFIYTMSLQGSLKPGSGKNNISNQTPINTGGYDSNSNSYNNSNTYGNYRETKPTNENRYGDKSCWSCLGSGDCPSCNGKGTIRHTYTNTVGDCPNCENGRCSTCGGDGEVFGLR